MNCFKFDTVNNGYKYLVKRLLINPDRHQLVPFNGCGKGKYINKKSRSHLDNVHIMIENPNEFTYFKVDCPKREAKMNSYMEKERDLFDKGIIDSNEMSKISKIWDLIKNKNNTINANYGYMVYYLRDTPNGLSQFEWCQDKLIENIDTLQAYMHFNRPKDQFDDNLDQPCTLFTQFNVINNKLNFTSYMRSNDVIYGTPYNIAYFIELQRRMCKYLNRNGYNIQMGSLYHNTTSLHLYDDKRDIAKSIIGLSPCKE